MNISKILFSINAYTKRLESNKNAFDEKTSGLDTEAPQERRQYDVAIADRRLSDTFAKSDFVEKYKEALAAMRKKNHTRTMEPPTVGQMNILTALGMIPSVPERVLKYAAESMNGNAISLYALNAIARKNKLPQVDIFLPMSEEEADNALDTLEKYCEGIAGMKPDEYLSTAREHDTNKPDAFIDEVLHVPAMAFRTAVETL